LGFGVLYFPYDSVVKAFKKFGINADFDENTTEIDFKQKINDWQNHVNKENIAKELLKLNKNQVDVFFELLTISVSRFIDKIYILPLHGQESSVNSINEAITLLKKYADTNEKLPFVKYEIIIKYNTGDKIEASFKDKKDAIKFLETYTK
jgi:hypothetical protein